MDISYSAGWQALQPGVQQRPQLQYNLLEGTRWRWISQALFPSQFETAV